MLILLLLLLLLLSVLAPTHVAAAPVSAAVSAAPAAGVMQHPAEAVAFSLLFATGPQAEVLAAGVYMELLAIYLSYILQKVDPLTLCADVV